MESMRGAPYEWLSKIENEYLFLKHTDEMVSENSKGAIRKLERSLKTSVGRSDFNGEFTNIVGISIRSDGSNDHNKIELDAFFKNQNA